MTALVNESWLLRSKVSDEPPVAVRVPRMSGPLPKLS